MKPIFRIVYECPECEGDLELTTQSFNSSGLIFVCISCNQEWKMKLSKIKAIECITPPKKL